MERDLALSGRGGDTEAVEVVEARVGHEQKLALDASARHVDGCAG